MLNAAKKQFYNFRKFSQITEYWAYLLADMMSTGSKTRFVIFSQGRTGSTLLVNLLSQHPEIFCDNELVQKRLKDYVRYFEGRSLMTLKPVYGFNVHPYQIIDFLNQTNSRSFVKNLFDKGWKIIYLRRTNIFRHALSNEIAKKRGYFFKTQKDFEQASQVYIDPKNFKKSLNARFRFKADEAEALKDLPCKELVYEDSFFTDNQKNNTIKDLYQYLGVDHAFRPRIPFIRTTQDNLSSIIANMEEINQVAKEAGIPAE